MKKAILTLSGAQLNIILKALGHTGMIPYKLEDRAELVIGLLSEKENKAIDYSGEDH